MAMYDRGVSIPQAASIWGCSVKVLRRMIREHGIRTYPAGSETRIRLWLMKIILGLILAIWLGVVIGMCWMVWQRSQIGHPLTVELPQGISITLNGLSYGSSTR